MSERTQQATARRRREARAEGRVVASPIVVKAALWLTVATVAFSRGEKLLQWVRDRISMLWQTHDWSAALMTEWFREQMGTVWAYLGLLCGLILVLAVVLRLGQTGFLWVPNRVAPKFERINPAKRWSAIWSVDQLVDFMHGLVSVIVALGLLGFGLWWSRDEIIGLAVAKGFGSSTVWLLATWSLRVGALLVVVAAIDYALRYQRFEQSLLMTEDEKRAEIKAIEGNPAIGKRRRPMNQETTSASETVSSEAPGSRTS